MFNGTQSDKIRLEQSFRANAKKYQEAGDTTSMTDWEVYNNKPITELDIDEAAYYRKRLNNDGTYALLWVEKDRTFRKGEYGWANYWDSGLYYAKLITINVNEETPEKYRDMVGFPFSECKTVWEEDSMFSELGHDTGAAYIWDLMFSCPKETFEGKNYKGETVRDAKDCLCTMEQLRAFGESMNLDISYKIPDHIYNHWDPEHNREW